LATFTNQIIPQALRWIADNPTRHPQYIILFPALPSRVWVTNSPGDPYSSLAFGLRTNVAGIQPFITSINMGLFDLTNDCIAYINKLEQFGTNYASGGLIVGPDHSLYSSTNFLVDDVRHGTGYTNDPISGLSSLTTVAEATNGLIASGVSPLAITYATGREIITNGVAYSPSHITNAVNVAGYICWGAHSELGNEYARNGVVRYQGTSGWWVIETVESLNGWRATGQGNFTQWFSQIAFGGTNYENTPVGAVTHTDEPNLAGVNDSQRYFGFWASGKTFATSAWNSRRTPNFQAVGDPFVTK
jgi:hypothetical protein